MPCSDITEVIRLDLDRDERLVHYTLTKQTCGAEVGQAALLLSLVLGLHPEELAKLPPEAVLEAYAMAEPEEFLYWKHLVALNEAAAVLIGDAAPDRCTPSQLVYDAQGRLHFEALVAVDALTDKIKACGNCRSCGSARTTRRRAP